jgi:hypothetical protein
LSTTRFRRTSGPLEGETEIETLAAFVGGGLEVC